VGAFVFHVFGALAEFERELIRERTRAGLDFDRLLDQGYTRVPDPPATEIGPTAQDFWDGTVPAPVE
jgi:hypothetical protein